MSKILLLGAGRSSSTLIHYLLSNAINENWEITVADISINLANEKTNKHPRANAIAFDVTNEIERYKTIEHTDIVISLLPAHLHYLVAKTCVKLMKHLVTASYVSNEIKELDIEAKKVGIILLNEIGLDPGIDHLSAMQIIDNIRAIGGEIISFKSYCGGLIAPETKSNPWEYKFTWNPRNVILAGQGTAHYINNGQHKYIPYNRLFLETETVNMADYGTFEAYANRDSLTYQSHYGLEHIPTLLRGTLRMPSFCKAWNMLIQLGFTNDSYKISGAKNLTYKLLLDAFLPKGNGSTEEKLTLFLMKNNSSDVLKKLEWLGICDDTVIQTPNSSPAEILQALLEKKWKLLPEDIDMVVMHHELEYKHNNKTQQINASLVVKGDNAVDTAMAKTVGLPVGIATKLILNNKITQRGVLIPTDKEFYIPVLKELETFGIKFKETVSN